MENSFSGIVRCLIDMSTFAKKMYEYMKAYPEKPSAGITIDGMANNPFVTHIFTADPSAHVWDDGRLYVYASHDIFPPRGCDYMDRYHVFSTDNMIDWTDHGYPDHGNPHIHYKIFDAKHPMGINGRID